MARCSHCLSDIRKDGEIVEEIDGKRLSFCCQSCASIYRILHNAGLEEFYRRRTGWSPGPPEETKTDPSLFYDYLKGERGNRVLELTISGIRCASCIWLIEHYLKKEQAIEDIRINYATHRARIRWDDQKLSLDRLLNLISSIGYTPRPGIYSEYQEALEREKKDLLIRFGTSCFFSMQLMLYSVALYAGYFQGIEPVYKRTFQFIAWALATPVLFYGGAPFIRNTLSSIKHRSLNMDVLILLGSGSAYLYSVLMLLKGREVYFDTASMIITLILLGRFLEVSARRKAGQALQRLIELQPTDARLITPEGKPLFLPVSSIKRGQRIEVQPGEKIPLDGIVVEGEAEVDESMLTGESRPSRKTLNSEVFAGTLNINGRLVIEVSRLLKDTVLSQIITAVEEAQSRKAPVQSLADRVVGWFVPLVFSISVLTFLFWFIKTSSIEPSLMNAVSVMVIACPCALGLATPLAVLIGSLRASTKGILIKGGDILEQAAKTEVVFIDKTGTLTEGKPSVTDIKAFINRDDLIYLSCVAEASAGHSLGRAILKLCDGVSERPEEFKSITGKGIRVRFKGREILIGNRDLMNREGVLIDKDTTRYAERLSSEGKTVVYVALEGRLAGVFGIVDYLKPDARDTIKKLRKLGLKTVMLTGDALRVAKYIAQEAGIDEVHAGLDPLQKVEKIKQFKQRGAFTMMVGDGINDAPSLTEADVGVAAGRATDIALESASVVIMKKELMALVELLNISKKTLRIIRENLFWAFSYNFIAIPLAVTGLLHPILSAASMAISSLVVVSNSLRLLRY